MNFVGFLYKLWIVPFKDNDATTNINGLLIVDKDQTGLYHTACDDLIYIS